MSNMKAWIAAATKYNGSLVIWIDQSTDKKLLAANQGGVCFAITRGWIKKFTQFREDRFEFINSFSFPAADSRIPAEYLKNQVQLRNQLIIDRNALSKSIRKVIDGRNIKTMPKAEKDILLEQIINFRKAQYGKECHTYTEYKKADDNIETTIELLFLNSISAEFACYAMLSMKTNKRGSGHVVGFEIRPDYPPGEIIPKFGFFDANLGYFVFPSEEGAKNFFLKEVYPAAYSKFNTFAVAEFDVGFGGIRTIDEELAELEAQIERGEL